METVIKLLENKINDYNTALVGIQKSMDILKDEKLPGEEEFINLYNTLLYRFKDYQRALDVLTTENNKVCVSKYK